MKFEEVVSILSAVGAEADIVGLAITEFMPWDMIGLSTPCASLRFRGSDERCADRFGPRAAHRDTPRRGQELTRVPRL